jgi:hypothetical protein
MNDRMMALLDRLAEQDREEEQRGHIEILPPLHAEIGRPVSEEAHFPLRTVVSFAREEDLEPV